MNKVYQDLIKQGINKIIIDEPLYKHTTYRVGGPALIYVEASSFDEIGICIKYAKENNIKYLVLGNGSNVLISDAPFKGIVIATKNLNSFEISDNHVYAMCGVNLINLAYKTAFKGLSGLEFASGIPGCVGGAIFMNAGAYKKDMASIIKRVLILKDQEQVWLNNEQLMFSYRKSILQNHRDWIVLAVELELEEALKDDVLKLIEKRKERRYQSQPYDAFSAGSVFKNPSQTLGSWQLIDEVGLRGAHLNDAQVSIKHSNFIINKDRASSKDIYHLIMQVKNKVKEKKDIDLKIEIELVNFDEE
ncbi:MAG: UDP-N-acetylmuramate dehydrogenase [Bacilli bacterium]